MKKMKNKKDLEIALGLTSKQLENKLERVFKLYDIDKLLFKENEEVNSAYQFTEKSFNLLIVLIQSLEDYPLESTIKKMHDEDLNQKRQRAITAKELNRFNERILNAIETMPDVQTKASILMSPVYEKTVLETVLLPTLEEKFSELVVATTTLNKGAMIEFTKYLIQMFDEGIYKSYLYKLDDEAAFEEELVEEIEGMGYGLQPQEREIIQMNYSRKMLEDRNTFTLDDQLARMLEDDGQENIYREWKKSLTFVLESGFSQELKSEKTLPLPKDILAEVEKRSTANDIEYKVKEMMLKMQSVSFENLDELAEANVVDCKYRMGRLLVENDRLLGANAFKYEQVKSDLELIKLGNVYAMDLHDLQERGIGGKVKNLINQIKYIREDIYYALYSLKSEVVVDTDKLVLYERLDDQLNYAYQIINSIPNQALATTKVMQKPEFYEGLLEHYKIIKENVQSEATVNPAVALHAFVENLKKYAQK